MSNPRVENLTVDSDRVQAPVIDAGLVDFGGDQLHIFSDSGSGHLTSEIPNISADSKECENTEVGCTRRRPDGYLRRPNLLERKSWSFRDRVYSSGDLPSKIIESDPLKQKKDLEKVEKQEQEALQRLEEISGL